MRKVTPLHGRFWPKVRVVGGDACWEWQGARMPLGYGNVNVGKNVTMSSHVVAWLLTSGPIPDGMRVLHRCDNPPCCRPDHLFLGTQLDNMLDASRKGRIAGVMSPAERADIIEAHASGARPCDLAREYGVSAGAIDQLIRRRRLSNH